MERELCEKLYNTCYMRVYSYLMTLCRDEALAEELCQETFTRAYASPAQFENRSSPVTWLCAIGKNLFTDEMRRRGKLVEASAEPDAGVDLEAAAADRDLSFRIHRVLHTLKEPYREVFTLRVFGELSFAQIGELFGKTESWARVTHHRAKLLIQERMAKDS